MKKLFHNYKHDADIACKVLAKTVGDVCKLREENKRLTDERAEQKQTIKMLEGSRMSQDAAIKNLDATVEKLRAELKVRCGEVATLNELVERQGEELKKARETLRQVRNLLR